MRRRPAPAARFCFKYRHPLFVLESDLGEGGRRILGIGDREDRGRTTLQVKTGHLQLQARVSQIDGFDNMVHDHCGDRRNAVSAEIEANDRQLAVQGLKLTAAEFPAVGHFFPKTGPTEYKVTDNSVDDPPPADGL